MRQALFLDHFIETYDLPIRKVTQKRLHRLGCKRVVCTKGGDTIAGPENEWPGERQGPSVATIRWSCGIRVYRIGHRVACFSQSRQFMWLEMAFINGQKTPDLKGPRMPSRHGGALLSDRLALLALSYTLSHQFSC